VAEALRKGRTDQRDFERWKNFHSSLKLTIGSWKVFVPLYCAFPNRSKYPVQNPPPSGDAQAAQPSCSKNMSPSTVCPPPSALVPL
jgi:hypothetical protein